VRTKIPTMRVLMEDPLFRQYMKIPPRLPKNLRTGNPYQIWVNRDGNWGTALKPTYADAWKVFVHHYKASRDDHRDVTLVSRRVFFAPPGEWYRVKVKTSRRPTPDDKSTWQWKLEWRWRQTFFWEGHEFAWCGRCRRPTYWQPLGETHHALRRSPAIAEEDNYRCHICGIRYIAMPGIDQMVKMERRPE